MKKKKEIEYYSLLIRLRLIFKLVQQLSWIVDQTEKRYTTPESMTNEEIKELTKLYMALETELREVYDKFQTIKKENE